MTKLTLAVPTIGELNTVAEPKVDTALQKVEEWANGKVGANNIEAEGVTEAMLTKVLQEKLVTNVGLVYATSAVSLEGVNGKFYTMTGAGTTLTLPTPTANRMIGGVGIGSATMLKVTASSGKIYHGTKTTGVTTAEFPFCESFLVFANGVDWLVLSGSPLSEAKWEAQVTREGGGKEYEPSATREVEVMLELTATLGGALQVGGVTIFNYAAGVSKLPIPFVCPAKAKWLVSSSAGTTTVVSSYRTR